METGKNSEFISIAEMAARVNKSKQWIYNTIKRKPEMQQYLRKLDGKLMIHYSAAWKVFGVGVEEEPQPDNDIIHILQAQLAEKDKQITTLMETLHREQLLHAETAARLKDTAGRLHALEDKQKEEAVKEPDPEPAHDPEQAATPEPATSPKEVTKEPEPQPEPVTQDQKQEPFWKRFLRSILG